MFNRANTLYFLILYCVLASQLASAQTRPQTIVFACSDMPPHIQNYFHKVYSNTFEDLGMNFKMVSLGLARAVQEATEDRVDGLCGKIDGFSEMVISEDLFKIQAPILSSKVSLWSLQKNLSEISTKGHLYGDFIIAHQRGSLASEHYVKEHNIKNVLTTWSKSDALNLLLKERVDMIIAGEYTIYQYNAKVKTKQDALVKVSQSYPLKMYPYLHKRFEHRAKEIESALRKAVAEHEYLLEIQVP